MARYKPLKSSVGTPLYVDEVREMLARWEKFKQNRSKSKE